MTVGSSTDVETAKIPWWTARTDGRGGLPDLASPHVSPRERQAPEPPEVIAGTLAHMRPNRPGDESPIDSRSDLDAIGVTFYQMLALSFPFSASDPMEWAHCHIATKPEAPSEC